MLIPLQDPVRPYLAATEFEKLKDGRYSFVTAPVLLLEDSAPGTRPAIIETSEDGFDEIMYVQLHPIHGMCYKSDLVLCST